MATLKINSNYEVYEIDSVGNETLYIEEKQYIVCWTDGRTNKEVYKTDYTMPKEEAENLAQKVLETKMKSKAPRNAPHKTWIELV